LDRMLTRLALCDDSKLQPLLSKLLPFTISSLSSQSSLVRNKVSSFSPSISMYIAVA
jgi:proteasome component ECM29